MVPAFFLQIKTVCGFLTDTILSDCIILYQCVNDGRFLNCDIFGS